MEETLKSFIIEKFPECRTIGYAKNTNRSLFAVSMRGYYGSDVNINIRSTDNEGKYLFIISTSRSGFIGRVEDNKEETFTSTSELAELLEKYFDHKEVVSTNREMYDLYTELEYMFGASNIKKCVVMADLLSINTEELTLEVVQNKSNRYNIKIEIGERNHFHMDGVEKTSAYELIHRVLFGYYGKEFGGM